jgi:dTDP-4-dehydrorhamnose reductase
MRILITGASGLLGLNLAFELAGARSGTLPHQVTGVVNTHALRLQPGQALPFAVRQADLLEAGALEGLLDDVQPDWVIHCAALANLEACEADPALARRLNTELPGRLAQLVCQRGARLLHVSTDAVFDGKQGGYTEQDAPAPLGVYAQTKLEGEHAMLAADPQALVARVNLFGWSLQGRRSLGEFFVNHLRAGRQVMGFTDVIFSPLLVNDLAAIFSEMLEKGLSGVYHTVSSECLSKYEFGRRVAAQFGLDGSLIQPTRLANSGLKAARAPDLSLKTDKLAGALGHSLPAIAPAVERFHSLEQQGYRQRLRSLDSQFTG